MKRCVSVLLAAMLLLCPAFALGEAEERPYAEDAALTAEEDHTIYWVDYDFDDITVGSTTHLDGKFFTGLWGNATSDIDVRHLVHGYNLVLWDGDKGLFRTNHSVVSGMRVNQNEAGDRSYFLVLYDDLQYSDGTPITAWDYAFSVLFQSSPVIAELGGVPADYSYLMGYEDYIAGSAPCLSGLRVLGDYQLQFTVKHEALPYFYEMFRLAFHPYPIAEIAPGCRVRDDGAGAYIANADDRLSMPLFCAEMLRDTVLDPENGYLSHPTVGSGPYRLISFDGETAAFAINPCYKGDEDGRQPTIRWITYTLAENGDMIRRLGDGEFTLLNKVTLADAIHRGLNLATHQDHQYTMTNYPRIGLTFLVFDVDSPAVQETAVRQAVALCLDQDGIAARYAGRFGLGMEGLYGLGQWMYALTNDTMAYPVPAPRDDSPEEESRYEQAMEAWEQVNLSGLSKYPVDAEEAAALLERAGWTLNAQGAPFDPDRDAVRYKEIGGRLVGLEMTMALPASSTAKDAFASLLVPNLRKAGVSLTLMPLEMTELLEAYNHRSMQAADMFYLGDDFNVAFDPSQFFRRDDAAVGDTLLSAHAELHALARDMCRTEPADVLSYVRKWVRFQERFSELLPMIPVYSNVYFDFYPRELHAYDITAHVSWADAIVPAYMSDAEDLSPEEVKTLEEELNELEAYFDE